MSFPEVLCELMDANGISNVSLGKALGVSDMAVARWKKGDACPSLDNAIGDIYLVSRALDHKDIGVTKRYIRIDEIEDKETARLYSPMDLKTQQAGVKVRRK